jgi:hypothetical protein
VTLRRWGRTVLWFVLWSGALWLALRTVHNAWGLVILGCWYVECFFLALNTMDLLWGRSLRRGV